MSPFTWQRNKAILFHFSQNSVIQFGISAQRPRFQHHSCIFKKPKGLIHYSFLLWKLLPSFAGLPVSSFSEKNLSSSPSFPYCFFQVFSECVSSEIHYHLLIILAHHLLQKDPIHLPQWTAKMCQRILNRADILFFGLFIRESHKWNQKMYENLFWSAEEYRFLNTVL